MMPWCYGYRILSSHDHGMHERSVNYNGEDILKRKNPSMSLSCNKQENIAFIKPHKTGGTTLASIINRFGYDHLSSFVISRFNRRNGHLRQLPIKSDSPGKLFLPPTGVKDGRWRNYRYNMIAVHLIYNETAMKSFMMPDTKYITILREPVSQFESFFYYMQLGRSVVKTGKQANLTALEAFFEKPDFYLPKLINDRDKDARNNQFYYLGLDPKLFDDERAINDTIRKIDRDFSLVLITDYFDESLLLMKKLFCWDMEDILYITKNQRSSRNVVPAKVAEKIHKWNRADVLLYDYFNRTLWRKIKEYGPEFDRDLAEFRRHLETVFDECVDKRSIQKSIVENKTKRTKIVFDAKKHSSYFCERVTLSHLKMHNMIWSRQYPWNQRYIRKEN
ncbi:galactosylceramide sulfotransferase-like isoform X2 [Ptychodera flava]|uniref:galactosylceramide sulfotransferase-like isoform X2 n=1 Tax=Ptychodera flava TaxID=63121 RepID=UPI003969C655